MAGLPATVTARTAWRQTGYRDGLKGWPHRKDIPGDMQAVYLAGWAQGRQHRETTTSSSEQQEDK